VATKLCHNITFSEARLVMYNQDNYIVRVKLFGERYVDRWCSARMWNWVRGVPVSDRDVI